MASLNLDLNYLDNVKTLRLVARLGPGSALLPIALWLYVGKHRPKDGILEGYAPAEIELICGWWGERGAMLQAMLDFNFIEIWKNSHNTPSDTEKNPRATLHQRYKVHDWLEHSGHLSAYKKRAEKAAKSRWSHKQKSSNASSNAKSQPKQCPSSTVLSSTDLKGGGEKKNGVPPPVPLAQWLSHANGLTADQRHQQKDKLIAELMGLHLAFTYQDELIERYFPKEKKNASDGSESIFKQAARLETARRATELRTRESSRGPLSPGV